MLTATIRTEIVAKGISSTVLTNLSDLAEELLAANVSQESIKQSRKVRTEADNMELNEIYNQVISIGTISRRFFKDNPAVQDQFSFAKILKNLRSGNLTTKFEEEILVSKDTPFILDNVRITYRYLYTTSTLVYVCRNPEGCTSQIESYLLTPEVQAEIRKADLVGEGRYLVFTNLTPGIATVKVRIMG